MRFAFFDASGRVDTAHNDDTISDLPEGAVALSDAQWENRFNLRLSGAILVIDPIEPALEDLRAAKNVEINVARASANTSTFAHGGKTFSCDQLSRSDIDGVNGYVALYGALPPGFPGAWKAVDNTYLPIADVEAWKVFYTAMVAQGAANFAHAQELKAQLAAATTPEAVAAIVW